jgi:hypothetical protein
VFLFTRAYGTNIVVSTVEERARIAGDRWLMLVHQLPPKPAYLRVKIWRRLQGLGAVSVKNSVYVLPASTEAQEDFEWLLREIHEGGGEALVCEARIVDGMTDQEVRALFDQARDAEYEDIAKETRELATDLKRKPSEEVRSNGKNRLAKLRARFAQVHAIDFFGANGREAVDGLLKGIEARLQKLDTPAEETVPVASQGKIPSDLKNRKWVTRTGVHIDRIGSAWLIRRFIDQEARFKFVPAKGYAPNPGELRFDMFEAEFTHEGDRCTFEVLIARAGLEKDAALSAIAEIVHDIDLKDGKFGRAEAEGIKTLIAGICNGTYDDQERLARGAAVFEDLYRSFEHKRGRRSTGTRRCSRQA